ncbi:carbohydrate ABC transporter permease, partial [Salinispira pacifica]
MSDPKTVTTLVKKRRFAPGPFFWLVLPAGLFTVLLTAFPMIYVLHLSTREILVGSSGKFVGIANYVKMVKDPVFWNGMGVTFFLYAICLAAQIVIGMYVAMVLNSAMHRIRFLRTILLSPLAMPPVAVGMMWLILLDPSFGPINYVLEVLGLHKSLFLASPQLVVPTLAAIDTWQYTPFVALILLGGLQSLPEEPYEAGTIDGATRFQMFWRITIPLLRPA